MSYRLEKFASTLQQALAEILSQESLNPEIRLATILRVVPAVNLKRASVFIACRPEAAATVLQQLRGASGFIKKQLGRKMILRYMPELDFTLDTTANLEIRLDKLKPRAAFPSKDGTDNEAADR